MIRENIVKEFGEAYISLLMYNLGFKVDRLDEKGIDLACYKDNYKYGVSVKARNIHFTDNKNVQLEYNDIVYTYDESKIRGLVPAYAFVIASVERIDIFIFTHEYMFKKYFSNDKKGIRDIYYYKSFYSSRKDKGSAKHIPISFKAREHWKTISDEEGVIFTASYNKICK